MPKILVDATPLLPKPSGVGFYVTQLLAALDKLQASENFQLEIIYQPSLKNWLRYHWQWPEVLNQYPRVHLLPWPVRLINLLAALPENPLLAALEQDWQRPQVIHGTNFAVYPSRYSRKVMTIYDLAFIKYPQYVTSVVKTYRARVQQSLSWTDLILAISESTKRDLVDCFDIDPQRIWVTPLASRYSPNPFNDEQIQALKQTVPYDFTHPYLLFVSTLEPRKNLLTLIAAFNQLKQRYHLDHHLVLIGQKGWQCNAIFAAIAASPWRQCIHHLDYLTDDQVALFYIQADVFVYPSYYEGFGLPPLEAMTLGTPVVTANTASLPEVVGDAGIQVSPRDLEALVTAIHQVVCDRTLRQTLIDKGHRQAAQFSWEKTARTTLAAYRSLLE